MIGPAQHTGLVIEDDPEMLDDLRETLISLGYECMCVTNRAEAIPLIDKGGFCFVILDLEIKTEADSIKARIEAGQSLITEICSRFPRRYDNGNRLLPIIILSAHGREHGCIVDAFQRGASDFIKKPFDSYPSSLSERIEKALSSSGRQDHANCAAIGRRSRFPNSMATVEEIFLEVTSKSTSGNTIVIVNQREIKLSASNLLVLLQLIEARLRGENEGWVHKMDLRRNDSQSYKEISRLSEKLSGALPNNTAFYENDSKGSYRLTSFVNLLHIDHAGLMRHDDLRVREISGSIGELLTQT